MIDQLLKEMGISLDDGSTTMPVTALILRKAGNKLLIMGTSMNIPEGIKDDEEYLYIGEAKLTPAHIFHEYKHDKGNSPNELLSHSKHDGAGLNYNNYKTKIK